ncbi:WhiB family transcriptional regulator [Streptomyces chrestomyceticus]|uniref:WhiB family transcriptional regulator n=1 Tax=Streptomyces chrestomyceticus TaxID=68185 RepID=UPI0033CA906E
MLSEIDAIVDAARDGEWSPLLDAAGQVHSKEWAEQAACAGEETELFFPQGDAPGKAPDVVRGVRKGELIRPLLFCAHCPVPVAARCLLEALELDADHGIRAGLLASERTELHHGWNNRVDVDRVSAALRGNTVSLTDAEEREIVTKLSNNPSLSRKHAARAMGIKYSYLMQLIRDERKRQFPSRATESSHSIAA